MGRVARIAAGVGCVALGITAGCAGPRIDAGVYHSPKGYRVTLPGPEWVLARGSDADVELRHRSAAAGMLVNADCEAGAARRSLRVLARLLLLGVVGRTMVEEGDVALDGRRALHRVLQGRLAADGEPVRIETYLLADDRCVYDLVYVAPRESFEAWRADFRRLVETFAME